MFSPLKKSTKQKPVRLGRGLFGPPQNSNINNPRFASFLSRSNPVPFHTDNYDARLRRKKRLKTIGIAALSSLATWIAIESAMALSLF